MSDAGSRCWHVSRHWLFRFLFHYHVRNVFVAALLVVLSLVILNNIGWPFVWIGLAWSSLFLLATATAARPFSRVVWFNLAFACATLTSAETYLAFVSNLSAQVDRQLVAHQPVEQNNPSRKGHHAPSFIPGTKTSLAKTVRRDDLLGYAPTKNQSATVRKVVKDQLIYVVRESIDENGLRVTPPHQGATRSIVFFGGSYTFGQGVNDHETMPYVTGQRLRGGFQTYNFGFSGYGPHQMLAALEGGLVEETVKQPPRFGIYQAIPSHIDRSAGLSSWDQNGPRYLLNAEGLAERQGRFSDGASLGTRKLVGRLRRSFLIDRTLTHFSQQRIGYRGIELFGAIVQRSREIFEIRYPGSEFHVIFWDDHHEQKDAILQELRRRNIPVHLVGEIIPEFLAAPEPYQLHEFDHHPSAVAHERIGTYVANRIVRQK